MSVPDPVDASLPTGWRAILDGIGEGINPILLRDLRVYAKGKLILSAYFLIMSTLVLLAILYVISGRFEGWDGTGLLWVLNLLLIEVVGALVPNLVFERFRSEFGSRATELSLMSPLTPARLVQGKLMGAWCISLVVIASAMPVFATAYLLGGVNLFSILGVLAAVLLAAAVMPTAQLCMATQKSGRAALRILASLVFVAQILAMGWYASFIYDYFVALGYKRHSMVSVQTIFLLSIVVGGLLVAQFLYFVTVGRLRSEAENRDSAPRLSLAAAAYGGGAFALAVAFSYRSMLGVARSELFGIVACFMAYAFCLGFLLVSHSSPVLPRNLEKNWRNKPLRRLLLLPGIRSLSAYFLLNAAVILVFCFMPFFSGRSYFLLDFEAGWRAACAGMAPFMFIAIGMNIYRYLVLPHIKDKRSPNLLPMTILVGNLIVAIISVLVMVPTAYAMNMSTLHYLAAASNPIGLIYGSFMSWRDVPHFGSLGALFMMAQLLLLVPAIFRKSGGEKPGGSAANAP